jgi:uncharacterized membrane protein
MGKESNLVVLTFEGEGTAAAVYSEIERLANEKLVSIEDAVILEYGEEQVAAATTPTEPSGQGGMVMPINSVDGQVRVVQTHGKKGSYAAKGGGIGFLAGFLIGGPIGGMVVGAGVGAIMGALKDFGIDEKNVDAIKARLHPNTSALLLLGTAEDKEAFLNELRAYDPAVALSTLSPEMDQMLRDRLNE